MERKRSKVKMVCEELDTNDVYEKISLICDLIREGKYKKGRGDGSF